MTDSEINVRDDLTNSDDKPSEISRRDFIAATAAGATALGVSSAFAQEASSSGGNESYEYIVVGAGMIGAATAWYLSQSSSGVAVIGDAEPEDPSEHEGAFASHHDSSRFYRTLDPQRTWAIASDRSMRRYSDLEKESGIKFHKPGGNLRVYPPEQAAGTYFSIEQMKKVANEEGLEVEYENYDNSNSIMRDFPYFSFPEGLHANYETSKTAGIMDPRKQIQAHLKLARAEGAEVMEGYVVSVEPGKNGVQVTTSDGRSLKGKKVVLACGAWTNALLKKKLHLTNSGVTVLLAELSDADFTRLYDEQPCLMYGVPPGDPMRNLYYHIPAVEYPNGKRYMKLGLFSPLDFFGGIEDMNAYFQVGGSAIAAGIYKDMLGEVMPSVRPLSYGHAPCVQCTTPTHYPYIDELESGVFVATGGNATAAKCSDELGRFTANLMITGEWDDKEIPASDFKAIYA